MLYAAMACIMTPAAAEARAAAGAVSAAAAATADTSIFQRALSPIKDED